MLEELWSGKAEEAVKPSIQGGVTLETLRAVAVPAMTHCGVYFLMYEGHVVYVGQSINVHGRISNHMADTVSTKEFDAYAWVEVAAEDLGWVEAMYIAKFKPRYNRQNNRRG
jgi:excinuclease UvrABC nuclease subunit